MKKIDFIIKNFQAKAFIQDLKNEIGDKLKKNKKFMKKIWE